MPLNPQDIVRKEFREALRGYNQADVDLFLDEIVEEFTRLAEDNQKMKVRIAALQQEVARLREGRPVAAPSAGASREEVERLESDVRRRVRRFLEEQIKQIEAAGPSTTAERIAQEMKPEVEAPTAPKDQPDPKERSREPFWAGE